MQVPVYSFLLSGTQTATSVEITNQRIHTKLIKISDINNSRAISPGCKLHSSSIMVDNIITKPLGLVLIVTAHMVFNGKLSFFDG